MTQTNYYLYDQTEGRRVTENYGSPKVYSSKAAAKGQATRLTNKTGHAYIEVSVAEYSASIDRFDPMVPTRNLLSGKECMIRRSELGTCTDPGTERYHCM